MGPRFVDTAVLARERGEAEQARGGRLGLALRVVAFAVAALSLSVPLTSGLGIAASLIGAAGGVLGGELLGRSRLRAWLIAAGGGVLLGLGLWLRHLVTSVGFFADLMGPAFAVKLAIALRFGTVALFPVAVLRALAVRVRALVALELGVVAAAIAFLFASHRGGVVARPLWLGDWAWRAGLDPVKVLLAIGFAVFVLLAAIMAAEQRRKGAGRSALALAAVAALVTSFFGVSDLPKPKDDTDLGLTSSGRGDPAELPHSDVGEPIQRGGQGPRDGQRERSDGLGGPQGEDQRSGGGSDREQGGEAGERGEQERQQGGRGQQDGRERRDGQQGDQEQQGRTPQDGDGSQQQRGDEQQGQQRDGDRQQDQPQDSRDDRGGSGQQQRQDDGRGGEPPPEPPSLDRPSPPDSRRPAAPMAVVILADDYEPPAQAYYFRQEVWSQFSGRRLVAPTRPDVDRDVPGEFPSREIAVLDPPAEDGRKRVRGRIAMVVDHKKPFALESPTHLRPLANPAPGRFVRAYEFEALAQSFDYEQLIGRRAGDPRWGDEVVAFYTQPSPDGRFAELARTIVAALADDKRGDPFLQALAIKLWMDENLSYSTSERHAGAADPTAAFLFGNRIGYCVHFAHAAVFLWRSLGLPARVGMGYAVDAETREGSAIMIRSSDAHAWPELYLEGIGWVVLDVRPQRNLDPPGQPADKEVQRQLSEIARQDPPDEQRGAGADPAASPSLEIPWRRLLSSLAVAAFLGLYAVKIWRRLAPRFASRRTIAKVGYRAALDMLSELGMTRRFGETRESFARRLSEQLPAFEKLTWMHVAVAFDPRVPVEVRPECAPDVWRRDLVALRAELRKLQRGWRAYAARLNPISFLFSR